MAMHQLCRHTLTHGPSGSAEKCQQATDHNCQQLSLLFSSHCQKFPNCHPQHHRQTIQRTLGWRDRCIYLRVDGGHSCLSLLEKGEYIFEAGLAVQILKNLISLDSGDVVDCISIQPDLFEWQVSGQISFLHITGVKIREK
jgi:hypothetical protein